MTRPFKAWLGRIMMNVSIDYYSANLKMAYTDDLDKAEHLTDGELVDRNFNYEDLLRMVQQLPQAYRTVFNLFAIDGYSHEEIGDMLNISPGTSKSNLHKATTKIKSDDLKSRRCCQQPKLQPGDGLQPHRSDVRQRYQKRFF
jgi:RNA polymerase sigma factor (sigma-70 family)